MQVPVDRDVHKRTEAVDKSIAGRKAGVHGKMRSQHSSGFVLWSGKQACGRSPAKYFPATSAPYDTTRYLYADNGRQ
jgi:hypothetical protein